MTEQNKKTLLVVDDVSRHFAYFYVIAYSQKGIK